MATVDKPNDPLNKKDLELILEVNKKVIQIDTEVIEQNEEIIKILTLNMNVIKLNAEKIDKIVKGMDDLSKDVFKIQVLFISGLLSLVIQIINIWKKG